jgi:hypothetical protein
MLSTTIRRQIRIKARLFSLNNANRCLFTAPIIKKDEKQDKHQDKSSQPQDSTENTKQDQVEMSIQDELKAVSTQLKEVQVN